MRGCRGSLSLAPGLRPGGRRGGGPTGGEEEMGRALGRMRCRDDQVAKKVVLRIGGLDSDKVLVVKELGLGLWESGLICEPDSEAQNRRPGAILQSSRASRQLLANQRSNRRAARTPSLSPDGARTRRPASRPTRRRAFASISRSMCSFTACTFAPPAWGRRGRISMFR